MSSSKAHKPAADHPWRKSLSENKVRAKIRSAEWRKNAVAKVNDLLKDNLGSPEPEALNVEWETFAGLDRY